MNGSYFSEKQKNQEMKLISYASQFFPLPS